MFPKTGGTLNVSQQTALLLTGTPKAGYPYCRKLAHEVEASSGGYLEVHGT